jgi:hypothetical protein
MSTERKSLAAFAPPPGAAPHAAVDETREPPAGLFRGFLIGAPIAIALWAGIVIAAVTLARLV